MLKNASMGLPMFIDKIAWIVQKQHVDQMITVSMVKQ